MEVKLSESLRIESEIPLLEVKEFSLRWKLNEHACLQIIGMADRSGLCKWDKVYGSKVRLWREGEEQEEILFYGCLKSVNRNTVANMEQICLNVESSSCRLDIGKGSQSFQETGRTYSDIVKEIVEENGGLVICTEGRETQLGKPIIRYEETVWEFLSRLAGHLKTFVVPDIESGKTALWFGLPKERQISEFPEDAYIVRIEHVEKNGISLYYEVESREFHKIGAQATFLKQKVVISEVSGRYKQGELVFTYRLNRQAGNRLLSYQNKFAGLGLAGRILEVQKETVRVALDIDGGKSTGAYFYDWYPETSNALYAMPEKDAKIILYFPSVDEREGFVVHCLPDNREERTYSERCLELKNKGMITLSEERLEFSRSNRHKLSISDGTAALRTTKHINILAQDGIRIKADRIFIEADAEVKLYQG